MNKCTSICVIIAFLLSINLIGQSDLGSWSSIKWSDQFDDKTSISILPIVRHNQNLSNYSNVSIDVILSFKINKNFSFNFLNRHWWMESGVNRHFWFLDLKYQTKLSRNIQLSQILRWHQAFDIDVADPDFFRTLTTLSFPNNSRFTPLIAADLFFRRNGFEELQRTRYKLGTSYKFNQHWSFNLILWKQDRVNLPTQLTEWIIVPSLAYKM